MFNYIPMRKIASNLKQIQSGDILYIASDLFKLAAISHANGEKMLLDDLIRSFQEKLGKDGTILIPTYNWDFCKGKTFDYVKTPGTTGTLGNFALKKTDFKRTKHPIYSFAVWGKYADTLVHMENQEAFGTDSPFAFMYQNKAKYLSIGITPSYGLTYVHYTEQLVGVSYRYHKNFTGMYVDEHGEQSIKTYSMYVRDLELNPQVKNNFCGLDDELRSAGALEETAINSVEFGIIDIGKAHDVLLKELKENGSANLYLFH